MILRGKTARTVLYSSSDLPQAIFRHGLILLRRRLLVARTRCAGVYITAAQIKVSRNAGRVELLRRTWVAAPGPLECRGQGVFPHFPVAMPGIQGKNVLI